jgi:hypothetical protein
MIWLAFAGLYFELSKIKTLVNVYCSKTKQNKKILGVNFVP